MERKEPSLAPEWLKGAAGGGTGGSLQFSQQSFHQDGSGSLMSPSYRSSQPDTAGISRLGEYDSFPHVATPEREFYPSLRRPGSCGIGGLSDKSNSDLDTLFHSKPSSASGRGSFYHSNEGLDRDSHLRVTDHGWNYDKDRAYRDRDKDRASAFTAVNNKDKNRESTDFSALHRLSAGKTIMYDVELPLRRVQSMVASRRINVNGDKERATELLGSLTDGINTTGKLQKADFDHGMLLPSTRAATPPALLCPTSSESLLAIREAEDGYASNDLSASSYFIGSTSAAMKETTTKTGEEPSLTRSPTTSKHVVDNLRLEELELRQSRQLIPMKPSFPKTMVSSPREKLKPKVTRSVELGSSIMPKGSIGSNSVVDGFSQTSGPNAVSTVQRKPKQLFDRRAVPISSMLSNSGTDGAPTQRPKEPGAVAEDKRPSVQVQNRTDFFNTLRRKAAGSGDSRSNFVRSDSVLVDKTDKSSKKNELDASLAIPKNHGGDDAPKLQERIEGSEDQESESQAIFSDSTLEATIIAHSNSYGKKIIVDKVELVATKSSMDLSDKVLDTATNSEEDEEAFMRSLGWEDNAEEEEALTEEEIKTFYEQHGDFLATRTSWHKQRMKEFVMHSCFESPISSDLNSSETGSADELNVQ